jgi:hypothetical protein
MVVYCNHHHVGYGDRFPVTTKGRILGGLLMTMGGWSFWRFYGRNCLVVHGTGERHEQNIGYGHPSRTAATPKRNRGYSEQTGYANPLCDVRWDSRKNDSDRVTQNPWPIGPGPSLSSHKIIGSPPVNG